MMSFCACWVILHAFLLSADFFQTNLSGIPSECQTGLDPEIRSDNRLGPVVQSIVSLTLLLRRHLFKYMTTTLSNTPLFFVGKMCKSRFSDFSNKKLQCICNIYF